MLLGKMPIEPLWPTKLEMNIIELFDYGTENWEHEPTWIIPLFTFEYVIDDITSQVYLWNPFEQLIYTQQWKSLAYLQKPF